MPTEANVTAVAIQAAGHWFGGKCVARTEAWMRDRSGRPDALVFARYGDELRVLCIESKSLRTIKQLTATYDAGSHLGQSTVLGVGLGLLSPAVGLGLGLVNLLFGKGPHLDVPVSEQLLSYPAHYRVLAVPEEVRYDYPDEFADLAKSCRQIGFGLLVGDVWTGSWDWAVEPAFDGPSTRVRARCSRRSNPSRTKATKMTRRTKRTKTMTIECAPNRDCRRIASRLFLHVPRWT